jgi:transposase-like protein
MLSKNAVEDIMLNQENNKKISISNLKNINIPQFLETLSIENNSKIQTHINGKLCPYCHSRKIDSKGNYKNRKRYVCRECGKYFNDLTNSPFSGLHDHEKVKKYLTCMIEGYSIRKAASIVGISVSTSFRWRHKLLEKINKLSGPKLKELVETNEIKIPYSAKGQRTPITKSKMNSRVSIIFATDRTGKIDSDSTSSSERLQNKIFERISANNQHNSIIFSSNRSIFRKLKEDRFQRKLITSKSNVRVVNAEISNWKDWMIRFRGVATKYLRNYLHWFDFMVNSRNKIRR